MRKQKQCFIVQKKIMAFDVRDALRREREATIIEVTLTTERGKEMVPAIGFQVE